MLPLDQIRPHNTVTAARSDAIAQTGVLVILVPVVAGLKTQTPLRDIGPNDQIAADRDGAPVRAAVVGVVVAVGVVVVEQICCAVRSRAAVAAVPGLTTTTTPK